jgi:hypothetical protein
VKPTELLQPSLLMPSLTLISEWNQQSYCSPLS